MSTLRKLSLAALALLVFFSSSAFGRQPDRAIVCRTQHIVERGENLESIAASYRMPLKILAQANAIEQPYLVRHHQRLCIPYYDNYNPNAPWMRVRTVQRNTSVTVKGFDFPSTVVLNVLVGAYGSNGKNMTKMGTVNTRRGGKAEVTVSIPDALHGAALLDLRLQTTDGKYTADISFYNINSDPFNGYAEPPNAYILGLSADNLVSFTTANFPPGAVYDVYIGVHKDPWSGGVYIGSFDSGEGGSMTVTLPVPAEMAAHAHPALALMSRSGGYNIFKWIRQPAP